MWVFGDFELDDTQLELRRQGHALPLRPTPCRLLTYLVEQHGRLVPKEELLDHVWPKVAVGDAALATALRQVRQALGDDGTSQEWIETLRGRGYRFAAPAEHRRAAPAPPPSGGRPFVGRAEVLDRLDAALAEAQAGQARVVLIGGEAGIGKTRTCEEVARRAEAAGCAVAAAWCREEPGAPDGWPWVQILRGLESESTEGDFLARLEASAGSGRERFQLFDEVTRRIRSRLEDSALVVLLEDIHWADATSLDLLVFAARELAGSRTLLIATWRERAGGHEQLATAVAELERGMGSERLTLEGLSDAEVGALVEAASGRTLTQAEGAALRASTGGSPFFVQELARGLAPDSAFDPAGAPLGGQSVVGGRLRALPSGSREWLEVGAVLGPEFELVVLSKVAGRTVSEAHEGLAPALAAGLLESIRGGRAARFGHALVRDHICDDMEPDRRRALHARAAAALADGDAAPAQGAVLAEHLCRAGTEVPLERRVEAATAAGRWSREHNALEDAVRCFELALAALAAGPADPARRLALLLALGDAQHESGRVANAATTLREAADLARTLGDAEALGTAATRLGDWVVIGVVDAQNRALLEEALEVLGDTHPALRGRVMAHLAHVLQGPEDNVRRMELAREGVALVRESGDDWSLARVLNRFLWVSLGRPEFAVRSAMAEELRAIGVRMRHDETVMIGHAWGSLAHLEAGDTDGFDREWATYSRLAEQVREPFFLWYPAIQAAMRSLLRGDLHRVEGLLEDAIARASHLPSIDRDASVGGIWGELRARQGRFEELEPALLGLVEQQPSVPAWRAGLAATQLELGKRAQARFQLDSILSVGLEKLPVGQGWVVVLRYLAETCHRLGDPARAEALLEHLLPFDGHAFVVGLGSLCFGAAAHQIALLEATLGREREALEHFEAAEALNLRMGALPYLALTQLDHARLLARGGGVALEQARELAALAGETGREIGMTRFADAARAFELEMRGVPTLPSQRRRT